MGKDLWDIRKEFDRMKKHMNNLFYDKNLFGYERPFLKRREEDFFADFKTPLCDIYETEKEVIAKIEIPGVEKKDIKLEIKNGTLIISAKKEKKTEKKEKDYHRKEIIYSKFHRNITLPPEIDEKNVKANYKNGILHITIPKLKIEEKDKKYINIE